MKTLDYLHLNEKKVAGVASALHQLLADFQVHYTNLRYALEHQGTRLLCAAREVREYV